MNIFFIPHMEITALPCQTSQHLASLILFHKMLCCFVLTSVSVLAARSDAPQGQGILCFSSYLPALPNTVLSRATSVIKGHRTEAHNWIFDMVPSIGNTGIAFQHLISECLLSEVSYSLTVLNSSHLSAALPVGRTLSSSGHFRA